MRKLSLFMVICGLLAEASGCSHHKVIYDASSGNEGTGKGLVGEVVWMKAKKNAVDLKLTLTNNSEHPISFLETAMKLTFNGEAGAMGTNDFTGEMEPHAAQTGVISYRFEPRAPHSGTVVFSIDPIYSGANSATAAPDAAKKEPPLQISLPVQQK